ncbi:putative ribonuclease H-like domain-containing protein [Tanacetum coccineum]
MVPRAVLMKSGLVSVNTARQVNAAHTKTTVNAARPMSYLSKTTHSTVKRPIHKNTTFKNSNFNQRVNTVKDKKFNTARPKEVVNAARPKAVVNVVKGNNVNAVKASACWVWKPKTKIQVSDGLGPQKKLIFLTNVQGNPQIDLQDKRVIDSGCSRHITRNMSYLTDFEEIDGGYVSFRGNLKGGKITGRGTIKTGNLDFENVYFVKELKFNLFSVSQMCDKNNSVLFNDTECIVLSPNFKLTDESQVLLKVPRKKNMYSVDLKNIVPKGGLTCLFAKATSDEFELWHRRLGHINFKTMNKLVKGNLVRGLPSKLFENNQTCVACQKGKQHRASCKSKTVSSISQPLHMLHMDLFGPTFVKSLMKKMYCLVVIDDYNRFSWVFFLATKDETSGILKSFITRVENLIDQRVKVIRCGNGTEFKIKLRRKIATNWAARTMLADSKLPTTFWAESVNTSCYVQNRASLPLWPADPPYSQDPKSSQDDGSKPSSDDEKKVDEDPRKDCESIDQEKDDSVNNTNNVNAASTNEVNVVGRKVSIELPDEPNTPALEDIVYSDDDEDVGAEVDMNNLDTTIQVSPILTTRIHKDHPLDQVIGDLQSALQTRRMSKNLEAHGFMDVKRAFLYGLQVKQKEDGIFISQVKYVTEILKKFGFTDVKTASTPMKTQKLLLKDEDGE